MEKDSLDGENLASEILFQRSFYQGTPSLLFDKILKGDIKFLTFKKLKSYLLETSYITSQQLEERIKKISLSNFLIKKEDPLWALYLAKKNEKESAEKRPLNYKLLKSFFFKHISSHPLQLRLTKKFAKLTIDQVTSTGLLEKHLKSGNKMEIIYTFHILRLKKGKAYKTFLKDNMKYFEDFIRVKKSSR